MHLIDEYQTIRKRTEQLCSNLLIEDYVIQTMEDVSPPKWHLAHTTWFFETFILKPYRNYKNTDSIYEIIFNSYYHGINQPYPRHQRGFLARPSVVEIYGYRQRVDAALIELMQHDAYNLVHQILPLMILGMHHEQQHQELLLMDIKYNFFQDPSYPSYTQSEELTTSACVKKRFINFEGGLTEIGYGGEGFCFDNELPRHPWLIQPFSIANTLVSNEDYLEFIEDEGYFRPEFWLADAWEWLQVNQIRTPLYWQLVDKQWMHFTFNGLKPLDLIKPVEHVSFYEADAFARWQGCRLATEEEWEYAICAQKSELSFGDLWEWTSSAYLPYPGYSPLKGTIGEYNAKFMNNQRVLRGSSFATVPSHRRFSYRNYYGPEKRWQFSGIRLVKNN